MSCKRQEHGLRRMAVIRGSSFCAKQRCAKLVDMNPGYLGKHPKALALLTEGFAALYARHYTEASKYFTELRDQVPTQKFFLHWFWRMHAEFGLSNVLLEAGDI